MGRVIFLACLFFAVPCLGQTTWDVFAVGDQTQPVVTFINTNGVETQAKDDEWSTISGTIDYDYSTVGLSMELTECIALSAGSYASIPITPSSEKFVVVRFRLAEAIEATESFLYGWTSDSLTELFKITLQNDLDYEILALGGTTQYQYNEISASTSYYFQMRFKQGTGVNAECQLWVSTDGINWTDSGTSSDGTTTGQLGEFRIRNSADTEVMYFDGFIESDTFIDDASTL